MKVSRVQRATPQTAGSTVKFERGSYNSKVSSGVKQSKVFMQMDKDAINDISSIENSSYDENQLQIQVAPIDSESQVKIKNAKHRVYNRVLSNI